MPETRIADRVAAGARLLDSKHPEWHDIIDLDRLDMTKGVFRPKVIASCGCVLAQIRADGKKIGFYEPQLSSLGVVGREESDYGFNIPWVRNGISTRRYANLTRAWRREILARREQETTHA